MKLALAQINASLGNFSENKKKILNYCRDAARHNCDLVIFPEMALFGYNPNDLLERPAVVEKQLRHLGNLSKQIPSELSILLGAVTHNKASRGKPYHNSAVLLKKGKAPKIFPKKLLPTYDVFDENRHIEPGSPRQVNIVTLKGHRILITVCEDIWAWPDGASVNHRCHYLDNPLTFYANEDIDLVINLSASPFTVGKQARRLKVAQKTSRFFKAPLVYVNMVGGQDELIFDGGSFVLNKRGQKVLQSPHFAENLSFIDISDKGSRTVATSSHASQPRQQLQRMSQLEMLRQSLVIGIRDFAQKIGITKAHLGLSGGIDSALAACLAVDALGEENVHGLAMPGPFNRPESLIWAQQLARNLNIQCQVFSITSLYQSFLGEWDQVLGHQEFGIMHENIQARLRGLILMAYSNSHLSLLLNTSNKSELAVGYSTLYGDLCGGLSPLGDLLKTQVHSLALHYNDQSKMLIPAEIIHRPPSAELRADQMDQDTLPPYKLLDSIVEKLVVERKEARQPLEKEILKSLYAAEFKRWQAPPILKISDHAFGRGRRMPIAHQCLV